MGRNCSRAEFPAPARFALERHDLPLIQGSILVITAIYCTANLIADLCYAFFNPKIRYGNAVR